ncbi:hypothetical protein ACSTS3_21220 [Aquimarina muelleri]|uniref:hypothetical protein n=1 Tax=Aquimarina muelleri TaxID=279356 RepID=UPI003F688455
MSISLKYLLVGLTFIVLISFHGKSQVRSIKYKKTNTNFRNSILSLDESKFEPIIPLIYKYHNTNDNKGSDEWNKTVSTYLNNKKRQIPVTIYEWFYRITICTGDMHNGKSIDDIKAFINLNTNKGKIHHRIDLEDTHLAGYNNYFIKVQSTDEIEWVEVKSAFFKMSGDIRDPDDWFIKSVNISLHPLDQTLSTDKNSHSSIKSTPNAWLIHENDTIPDTYHTGNIGKGRLIFIYRQMPPFVNH